MTARPPPSKKMELVLPQLDEFMRSQQKSSRKPRRATSTVCHNTMEQIFEDRQVSYHFLLILVMKQLRNYCNMYVMK